MALVIVILQYLTVSNPNAVVILLSSQRLVRPHIKRPPPIFSFLWRRHKLFLSLRLVEEAAYIFIVFKFSVNYWMFQLVLL